MTFERTSTSGIGSGSTARTKKRRRPVFEEDKEINGFELTGEDVQALQGLAKGTQPDAETLKWLEECGLVSGGQLTELGQDFAK